jgi:hypothetical protein
MKDLSIRLVSVFETLQNRFPQLDKGKLNMICHQIISRKYLNRSTLNECGVSRHEFLLIYKELHAAYPRVFYSTVLSKLTAQRCKSKLNLVETFNMEESWDHAFFDILLAALNHKIPRKIVRMDNYNGGFIKKYNTLPFESISSCIKIKGLINKINHHCPFCFERSTFHKSVLKEIKSKVKLINRPFDEVLLEFEARLKEIRKAEELAEHKERQLMFEEDMIAKSIRSQEKIKQARIQRADERREKRRKQKEHQDYLHQQAAKEALEKRIAQEERLARRMEEERVKRVKNTLAKIRVKMLTRSLIAFQRAFRMKPKKKNMKRKDREEMLDEDLLNLHNVKRQIAPDTFINTKGNYILNVEVPRRAKAQSRLQVLLRERDEMTLMSREDQDATAKDDYTTEALEDLEYIIRRRKERETLGYQTGLKNTLRGKKWRFPKMPDNSYANYYRTARKYSKEWSSQTVHEILLYTSTKRDLIIPDDHEDIRKRIEDEIR